MCVTWTLSLKCIYVDLNPGTILRMANIWEWSSLCTEGPLSVLYVH